MKLKPLCEVHFDLSSPLEIGDGPFGRRVIYDVTGGTFVGERLRGKALLSGGDWVLFDPEGVARLDVKVTLETHDNARIYVHYHGVLVPNDDFTTSLEQTGRTEYGDAHFFTQPRFETGDQRYRWLNRVVAVAEGRAAPSAVEYRVFEVVTG